MKKFVIMAVVAASMTVSANAAPDIREILQGLGGKSQTPTEQTGESPANQSGALGDVLGNLESLGTKLGVISPRKVDVAYLTGTWNYNKPAVAFQSDQFLAKAGGIAASAKVESELAPYYSRVGLDKMVLTVEPDSTFTMKFARGSLSGTVATGTTDGTITFNFKVMGMTLGGTKAYVNAENASTMSITFDVSKLLSIMQKVAAFSGNTSLKTLSSLLSNYDGLTAGFNLKKK